MPVPPRPSRGDGRPISVAPDGASSLVALVRRASAGGQEAWDQLVDRYAGLVWGVARAHGLDEVTAADVSQMTWLQLADALDQIQDPEHLGAWLATTTGRESLRAIHAARRHRVRSQVYPGGMRRSPLPPRAR